MHPEGFNIDEKNITREDLIYIQFLVNIKTTIHAGMNPKELNNIKNFLLYSHFFYDEFKDDENAAIILLNSANMEEAVGGRIIFPKEKEEDGSDIFTYKDAKSVITKFKPDTKPSYTIGQLGDMVTEEIGFSFFSKDEPAVDVEMPIQPQQTLAPKNSLGSLPLSKISIRNSSRRPPTNSIKRTIGGGSKKRKYTKKHKKIRKHKHTRKHKPYKKTKHTRKNKTHKKTKHTRKNKQMSRRR